MAGSDSSDSNSLASSGSAFDDTVKAKSKETPEKKGHARTESVHSSPGRVRLNEMEDEEEEVVIVDDGTYPSHIVRHDDSPLTPTSEDERKSKLFREVMQSMKAEDSGKLKGRTVGLRLSEVVRDDLVNAEHKKSLNNKQKGEIQRRLRSSSSLSAQGRVEPNKHSQVMSPSDVENVSKGKGKVIEVQPPRRQTLLGQVLQQQEELQAENKLMRKMIEDPANEIGRLKKRKTSNPQRFHIGEVESEWDSEDEIRCQYDCLGCHRRCSLDEGHDGNCICERHRTGGSDSESDEYWNSKGKPK